MLTNFGKELRKIRVENDETLKDMGDRIGVSASFLSAVENGKKNVGEKFIRKIAETYRIPYEKQLELIELARGYEKIDLRTASEKKRALAKLFCENFEYITDDMADDIISKVIRPIQFDSYCKEMEEKFDKMSPEEFFDYFGISIDDLKDASVV